jgi:hypothetical protein
MADRSQGFGVADILWVYVETSGLIVSGGKDGAVIQIEVLEGEDHF